MPKANVKAANERGETWLEILLKHLNPCPPTPTRSATVSSTARTFPMSATAPRAAPTRAPNTSATSWPQTVGRRRCARVTTSSATTNNARVMAESCARSSVARRVQRSSRAFRQLRFVSANGWEWTAPTSAI